MKDFKLKVCVDGNVVPVKEIKFDEQNGAPVEVVFVSNGKEIRRAADEVIFLDSTGFKDVDGRDYFVGDIAQVGNNFFAVEYSLVTGKYEAVNLATRENFSMNYINSCRIVDNVYLKKQQ